MTTAREHTTAQSGPVLFEATTIAAHVTVIVEDRPAALIMVSTSTDSGPAADAVRTVSFEVGQGVLSVLLTEPAAAIESTTIVNRHGGVTINQVSGNAVVVMFGNLTLVNGIVAAGFPAGGPVTNGAPISIQARLPLGSSLACETTSGDVGTSGDLVNADAVTVSGDIHLDGVRLPHLRTTSGTVRIDRLTGNQATAWTVSGDIRIHADAPGASVRATSVSGDIRVTGSDIDLDARTVSGRVTTR